MEESRQLYTDRSRASKHIVKTKHMRANITYIVLEEERKVCRRSH